MSTVFNQIHAGSLPQGILNLTGDAGRDGRLLLDTPVNPGPGDLISVYVADGASVGYVVGKRWGKHRRPERPPALPSGFGARWDAGIPHR